MNSVRHDSISLPHHASATPEESNIRHDKDDSISWAIRTCQQVLCRDPYPTRSKHSSQSSHTSQNFNLMPTTVSSKKQNSSSSYARSSMSTTVSSKNQTSSSSPKSNKHILHGKLMIQSCFGYTAFDFHQRKVQNKDVHTSWYTYLTSVPIDSPPELPKTSGKIPLA
ncbi:hypothetical protein EV361DRAFT_952465 [Lentinula raphanica]|nr:hypothetical protein EV361DRAFT_952465 [Lentinula raphanica]